MEMTDSLSNLSAGDGGSSLGEPAFAPPSDSHSGTRDVGSSGALRSPRSEPGSSIQPDDLTVISQVEDPGFHQENLTSLEGKRIGNFELKQFLGGGGMGLVFRAFDSVLSRSVAIKILPRLGTRAETIQRFQVEARSAARLDHPNIARVFQVGSDDVCDYIIFEFVEGDNLAQLVRRIGPLPIDLALRYTFQLALALQHAYQRGVVHRDVKPANVVVTDGGKLKLIDLGLARSPKANESDNSLTATGVTLGTYDYLSPEQARDSRTADVRSDLYSLGCTLFFMLTAQPPYPQGTPIEKIIQHSSEKRPKPSDYRADLPSGFDTMVSRLLAIDPDDRYQRPAELIADIQELASRNNIPLLGYDDNVVVKKIITRPSWVMQLVPVLVPVLLLIGFVLYLDWTERDSGRESNMVRNRGRNPGQSSGQAAASKSSPQNSRKGKSPGLGNGKQSGAGAVGTQTPDPGALIGKKQNSASDGGAKAAAGASTAEQTILVVGGGAGSGKNLSFSDLESAVEAVNNDPRLSEIRLSAHAYVVEKPLSLKVNQALKISSVGENESLIVFRPSGGGAAPMLRIRGGEIEFQNVHLRLEVSGETVASPTANGAAERRSTSLMALEGTNSVLFSGGSMTIDNFGESGTRITSTARFIELQPSRKSMAMFDIGPKDTAVRKTSLTFKNCCLRGEADFLHVPESFPVTISMNNGLFVSDGVAFDFGPPGDSNSAIGQDIEIYVNKFTVVSSQGFVRLDAGSLGTPIPLRMVTTQSIFNYGGQNPLVAHRNLSVDFVQNKTLVLKCLDSFFPRKNPLWTVSFGQNQRDPESFDYDAMGDWLNITGVAGDTAEVTWQNFDGLAIPPSEHTVFDYELSGAFEKNPAIRWNAGLSTDGFHPIPPAFIE